MSGLYKLIPTDLNALISNYLLVKNNDRELAIRVLLESLKSNKAVKDDVKKKLLSGNKDNEIKMLLDIISKDVKPTLNQSEAKDVVEILKALGFGQQPSKQNKPIAQQEVAVEPPTRVRPIQAPVMNKPPEMKQLDSERQLREQQKDELNKFFENALAEAQKFKSKVEKNPANLAKSLYKAGKKSILNQLDLEHHGKEALAETLYRRLNSLHLDLKHYQKTPTQVEGEIKKLMSEMEKMKRVSTQKNEFADVVTKIKATVPDLTKHDKSPQHKL